MNILIDNGFVMIFQVSDYYE